MERETTTDPQHGREPSTERLRVDDAVTPVGIDTSRPRFTWEIHTDVPGTTQRWWAITVEDDRGDVAWDSGRHDEQVPWAGPADALDLAPLRRHRWTLTVGVSAPGDQETVLTAGSEFTTGPAGDPDWAAARWIGRPEQ